jgi:SAM-dependent methyltransferase
MNNNDGNISSPLVEGEPVLQESEISTEYLIKAYMDSLEIDISPYVGKYHTIKIYKCLTSGYRFYYPFDIGGDDKLYEQLLKNDWYYMPWKWEYDAGARWVNENDSVLEIGCGKGYFIQYLQEYKNANCVGLELISDKENMPEKVSIKNIPVEDFSRNNSESFDISCSFQVLEHISNVKDFLNAQINCIKKGGKLIISVPNNDSFIKYDSSFILNMPPHHMGMWEESSLRELEKHFGIRLIDIQFEPLQPYHFDYYYRTITREYRGFFAYKWKKLLYKTILKSTIHKRLERDADHIKGHTIMAVYEKPD